MKNLYLLLLFIFIFSCNANENSAPTQGKLQNGVYTNDFLGWKVKITEGWEITPNEQRKRWDSIGKEMVENNAPNEPLYLLSFHMKNDDFIGLMSSLNPLELYPNLDNERKLLEISERKTREGMQKEFGVEPSFTYGEYEIDNMRFITQDIVYKLPPDYEPFYQKVFVNFINNYIFTMAASWRKEKDKKQLFEIINSSEFK